MAAFDKASRLLLTLVSRLPGGIEVEEDVSFGAGGGRPLRLHIAAPPNRRRRAPLPAVVFIFGGGWRAGSRDQGALVIAALALRGFVAASIEYRLSSEAVFPAQIEDCKCAVRYLRANAGAYHLDPERIGVIGPSAGGHLAALLGTTQGHAAFEGAGGWQEQRSDVQAVVDWYGPADLLSMAVAQGDAASPTSSTARLIGAPTLERPDLAAEASPLTHASAASAPFLILHGAADRLVPAGQSKALHDALRKAGASSELTVVPGKGHGFLGVAAVRQSLAFLDRVLKAT